MFNRYNLGAENNALSKKLAPEYKERYDDIVRYLWESDLNKAEQEEICNDILDILLSGQNQGKPVEEVVGEDYITFAEEIINACTSDRNQSNDLNGKGNEIRRIPGLPSLRKKTVFLFYHIGTWLLAASIIATAIFIDYKAVRPVFWVIIIFNVLLYPLYVNSQPPQPSKRAMKRLILSVSFAAGIVLSVLLLNYVLGK